MKNLINNAINDSIKNLNKLQEIDFDKKIIEISDLLVSSIKKDKKILIAGNGGSASDAQHFAGELVGRFLLERRGYPAIALNTDTSVLTCIANDYSYDDVFSRQVEALGNKGDVFVGISTSGNSLNVIKAIELAKNKGMMTVGLIGKNGGIMKDLCDYYLLFPYDETARIQEHHILSIHLICQIVEQKLNLLK